VHTGKKKTVEYFKNADKGHTHFTDTSLCIYAAVNGVLLGSEYSELAVNV
jgi:hypothetical protein